MRPVALLVGLSSFLAGCVADDPAPVALVPTGEDPEDPPAEEPLPEALPSATFDGRLPLSIGTPVGAANPASDAKDFLFEFVVPENATYATATMTWNATSGTSQALALLVEVVEDGTRVGAGDGASPLVVAFDASDLEGATLRTRTFASASGGVAKDQPFTVVVAYT